MAPREFTRSALCVKKLIGCWIDPYSAILAVNSERIEDTRGLYRHYKKHFGASIATRLTDVISSLRNSGMHP
jgi:hypothetical protein